MEETPNFGWALSNLNEGKKLCRRGWNGKDMYIELQVPDEHSKMSLPYIYMVYPPQSKAYPEGAMVPWLASQTDLLSEDWKIVG